MRERLVGVERVCALRVVRVRGGLRARTRRAGLRVHDDAPFDRARRGERCEAQKRRGGEAAGVADETRTLDLFAVDLRQTVNELALQLRRRVLAPVVLFELLSVAQPEVARQVNHLHARRQARHDLQSLPVRQREEDAINVVQPLEVLRRLLEAQFSQAVQVAMNFCNRLARMLVRRHERDLHPRVEEQYPQKLRAAVARPAEDADPNLRGPGAGGRGPVVEL